MTSTKTTHTSHLNANILAARELCHLITTPTATDRAIESAISKIDWGYLCRYSRTPTLEILSHMRTYDTQSPWIAYIYQNNTEEALLMVRRELVLYPDPERLLREAPALLVALDLWGEKCFTPSRSSTARRMLDQHLEHKNVWDLLPAHSDLAQRLRTLSDKSALTQATLSPASSPPKAGGPHRM